MTLFGKSTEAVANAAGKIAGSASDIVEAGSRQGNATKRHSADMLSDNQLSKSIRPIVLIWAMVMFTVMVVLNYCGKVVATELQTTITMVLGLGVAFYFPGRTLEKYIKQKKSKKSIPAKG